MYFGGRADSLIDEVIPTDWEKGDDHFLAEQQVMSFIETKDWSK